MDNKKILEKLKMNIAVTNFEKEFESIIKEESSSYTPKKKTIWREYIMKKRIIATTCVGLILISGVAFATNIENIKNYFRGLGGGIDSAVENGYIEKPEMDYVESKTSLSTSADNIIDNIGLEVKVDNFLMDDYNLSVEFNFKFDDKIIDNVNLNNINNIELKDLMIKDEENRIIYSGKDEVAFNKYCKDNKLDYKFGEFNENYLNNGLNWFPSYHNEEERIVKLMYNMYTDKYPNSKKLYFSFEDIIITEENNTNTVQLKGNWKIELDVPEKMYNRTSESYKVISCSNEDFDIYQSKVSDTGFEIGVIINNIEQPKFPEELRKIQLDIAEKYKNTFEQSGSSKEWSDIVSKSPYKEMYIEYQEKANPINVTGINYWLPNITGGETKVEKEKACFVENSNGEKFECTMSPSRKAENKWLDGNKYKFYETFGMTKYEASDVIKVVLYYYGEPVIIELEKVK